MIAKYNDFINENLLLEANMVFYPEFLDLLKNINSPLTDIIYNINGEEFDINTNYITYDTLKDDRVLFKPDDKIEKLPYSYSCDNDFYHLLNSITRKCSDELKKEFNINDDFSAILSNSHSYIEIEKMVDIDKDSFMKAIENMYLSKNYIGFLDILKNVDIMLIYWSNQFTFVDKKYVIKNHKNIKESEISIGRFIRAILKKSKVEFTDKDIEHFVTEYKTAMRIRKESFTKIEEVSGEDIRHWYLVDNNVSGNGTLGNSCMNDEDSQEYLDIYCDNINQVNLIIMYSDEERKKICARALLWTDTKGNKFMDRIYTQDSSHERLFIEYAITNGYSYKKYQNYSNSERMLNRVDLKGEIIISLYHSNQRSFPYMDTVKYFYKGDGILSSDETLPGNCLVLTETDGGPYPCEYCDDTGVIFCWNCDNEVLTCDDCNGDGEFNCDDCDEGLVSCDKCNGSGKEDDSNCYDCEGSGNVKCNMCKGKQKYECDNCNGEGNLVCDECQGNHECSCTNY